MLIVYALGRYTPASIACCSNCCPASSVFRRPADATFLIGATIAILGGYLVHRVASGTMPLTRAAVMAALALVAAWFAAAIARRAVGRASARRARAARQGRRMGRARPRSRCSLLRRMPARASLPRVLVRCAADGRRPRAQQRAERIDRAAAGALRHARAGHAERNHPDAQARCSRSRCRPTGATASNLLGVGFEWPNAPMIHGFDHTLGYNPLRLADVSDATGARDYIAGPDSACSARCFLPIARCSPTCWACATSSRACRSARWTTSSSPAICASSRTRTTDTSTRIRARCRACCSP